VSDGCGAADEHKLHLVLAEHPEDARRIELAVVVVRLGFGQSPAAANDSPASNRASASAHSVEVSVSPFFSSSAK